MSEEDRERNVDVVVLGGASWEWAVGMPGQARCVEGPGGLGVHLAKAIAARGARVALLGAVGADRRGDALLDHLRAHGVETGGIKRSLEATGAIIRRSGDLPDATETIAVRGANACLQVGSLVEAADLIVGARAVVATLEVSEDVVRAALTMARDHGIRTLLVATPASRLGIALAPLADVLAVDAQEAEYLTGIRVRTRVDARHAGRELLARGSRAVLLGVPDDALLYAHGARERWLDGIERITALARLATEVEDGSRKDDVKDARQRL